MSFSQTTLAFRNGVELASMPAGRLKRTWPPENVGSGNPAMPWERPPLHAEKEHRQRGQHGGATGRTPDVAMARVAGEQISDLADLLGGTGLAAAARCAIPAG